MWQANLLRKLAHVNLRIATLISRGRGSCGILYSSLLTARRVCGPGAIINMSGHGSVLLWSRRPLCLGPGVPCYMLFKQLFNLRPRRIFKSFRDVGLEDSIAHGVEFRMPLWMVLGIGIQRRGYQVLQITGSVGIEFRGVFIAVVWVLSALLEIAYSLLHNEFSRIHGQRLLGNWSDILDIVTVRSARDSLKCLE